MAAQPKPAKRTALVAARKAAGFTQESLATKVGVERTTVFRWESGETVPTPWSRPGLAALLGISNDQLTRLLGQPTADTATSTAPPDEHPAQPPEPTTTTHHAATGLLPARGTAENGESVSTVLVHMHTERVLSPRPAGQVDPTAIDELTAQVADIAMRYETRPSASLLAEAGQCHAALSFLLGNGGSEKARRDLHRTATTSATLLSQLIWDASGRRDGAATLAYCDQAIDHATECGDVVSAANAELRKAYVALYGLTETRDPRTGLVNAQAAAHQSRPVSDALHGLAQLHVGEAFAMLGEYRQCERALSDAETALGRTTPEDAGAGAFSPSQFGRLAGSCYLFLGSPERAEPFLTRTAEQLHDRPKTRSLVLGNLALSYLRQRRLDAATATLHSAVDLLEQSRGGGGMTVVFGAARELYPWRAEPAVHDIHDRLLGLMATI